MLPDWVPTAAQMYLAHTEAGLPIRALARAAGCHASTILRQIRRIETRRDDPLVDAALKNLGKVHFKPCTQVRATSEAERDKPSMSFQDKKMKSEQPAGALDTDRFTAEATRVLRRLCETGAVLAVAEAMEKAVIVRDGAGGAATRTAVVDRQFAEALALKDWIVARQNGKITRYTITAAGRAALEEMMDAHDSMDEAGFAESAAAFSHRQPGQSADADRPRRMRYNMAESPLAAPARRKDKDGEAFLTDELVTAGERLREDFELAQMGPQVAQNWDRFLTGGGRGTYASCGGVNDAPTRARDRVAAALTELGPGLSDVVLRCCCYIEGLETAERKLGWSARSGKIVLRIALIRLKRHYDETVGPGGPLIG